jgi:hypothetical protein
MSEIENLEHIRDNGMDSFIEKEHKMWVSDNGILCIHEKKYYKICDDKKNDSGEQI